MAPFSYITSATGFLIVLNPSRSQTMRLHETIFSQRISDFWLTMHRYDLKILLYFISLLTHLLANYDAMMVSISLAKN